MSRRRSATKRKLLPDPKHGSVLLAKFIRNVMECGKLQLAESIVYQALDKVGEKVKGRSVIEIFDDVIDKLKPLVEVRSKRVGGATFQVPTDVRPDRATAMAMRWLRDAARSRKEKSMAERLANEIIEALEGRGGAMKKREDTHKMADANKAFSHFKW